RRVEVAGGWVHRPGADLAGAVYSRRGLCAESVSGAGRGRDQGSRVCAGGAANVPRAELPPGRAHSAAAVALPFGSEDRWGQPNVGERFDGLPDDLAPPDVYVYARRR